MKNISSNSWFLKIFILGLLIRFFLMATNFHPDLLAFHYAGLAFADRFVLNIYEYLHTLPEESTIRLYGTDFFTWPPLTYFLLGFFTLILKPLFNLDFSRNLTPENLFLNPEIFRHLFLLKVPYLLFDIFAAIILLKLFSKENEKRLVFFLWMFNPVTLYSSYMIGQFDIIPTFFVILAIFLAQKGKNALSLFSLGIGGALKVFPLLLVPFAAVILGRKASEKLSLFSFGLLPFFLTILPFMSSQAFRSVALFSTQSQKLLFAGINVSGADILYLFIIFYLLLLFYTFRFGEFSNLWKFFLAVFLLFFSLTNYHPQWFLWITPLFIIWIAKSPKEWFYPSSLFLLFVGIALLFEPSLSIGLFAPLSPSLGEVQGLSSFVSKFFPPSQASSILRSIFAAFSIWITLDLLLFKKEPVKNSTSDGS